MSIQPKTLRELCEAATPGPECPECKAKQKKYDNIDRRMAARGNFGIVPASPVCEKHFGESRRIQVARSQIHARLSPEVVLRVYEALEKADHYASASAIYRDHCMKESHELISLLDGQTSNGDKA